MDRPDRLSLDYYQNEASRTAVYPGQNGPIGLMYVTLKLNGEAGEVAEDVGKALRDDGLLDVSKLTNDRKEKLIAELGDVLWYVAMLARELHVPLSGIAARNLLKLRQRQAKGTLKGSGSDR